MMSLPTPVIDREIFDELLTLDSDDNRTFLAGTVTHFQARCQEQCARIAAAVARVDAETVGRAAHALAGSAIAIGAATVHERAARLEDAARREDWAQVLIEQLHLHRACREAIACLREELAERFGRKTTACVS